MRIALIVGISGPIGKVLTEALIANKNYKKVVILTRRDVRKIKNLHVRKVVVDFNELEKVKSEFHEVNDVFCLLGKNFIDSQGITNLDDFEYKYPAKIAEMAAEAGVPNFYILNEEGNMFVKDKQANSRHKLVDHIASLQFNKFVEFRISGVGKKADVTSVIYQLQKMINFTGRLFSLGKIKRIFHVPSNLVAQKMLTIALDEKTGSRVISAADY